MQLRLLALMLLCPTMLLAAPSEDPRELVKQAIEYWRDSTSYSEARMKVHRPDWERSMALKSWTFGRKHSLVRFTAPAKDAGSASLTVNDEMWSFAPKINRVIKIPASMMHQSWMGSDFSYNDLSKADDIIDDYKHKLIGEETHQSKKVYVVESIPYEEAPVVWGKEILKVREDYILLEHDFYDQDMHLVKSLRTLEIKEMGGKLYASRMRMQKAEVDEWTEIVTADARFAEEIPAWVFTLSNLRNPREK